MTFSDWKRERFIRSVLRRLARQRVEYELPDGRWMLGRAVTDEGGVTEALRTCHLRGWVQLMFNVVPHSRVTADGKLPEEEARSGSAPAYTLTEAGWSAIHRLHTWVVVTCVVALITLIATVVGLVVALAK